MILKASQRGGARALGVHLLRADENEHVNVHEVRGFLAEDVMGAMAEAEAVNKGTKCRQHLFSVSLSPPAQESVGIEVFEGVLRQIEERHGLVDQPRIIVFHEKEGRRHGHAVWSRIDPESMTAIPLPFFKRKMAELSRDTFLEQGWSMPRGLMSSKERDPRNFDLADWQQAKRTGRDPRELKSIVQECWAVSDSRAAFQRALEERGLYLAKGDRRGHVALTYEGEPLSIARYAGKKAKEVRAKLGEADDLRSVEEAKSYIAKTIAPKLKELLERSKVGEREAMRPLHDRRLTMATQHEAERQRLEAGLLAREREETATRAGRIRTGIRGLWDRLRGEYGRIAKENTREALAALQRDRKQRQELIDAQLIERRTLQAEIAAVRERGATQRLELHRDLGRQREAERRQLLEVFQERAQPSAGEPAHDPLAALRAARETRQPIHERPERPREEFARAAKAKGADPLSDLRAARPTPAPEQGLGRGR